MKYQKIYDSLPIFLQNLMASIYGYKVKKERYGSTYYKHLEFLRNFELKTKEQQEKYQLMELKRLINYSVEKSSFYRKLYSNIDLNVIQSIEDLKKLPIVTKEMFRENIKEINTEGGSIVSNTGGTTGKPLTIFFTPRDFQKRMATLDYFKSKHGFKNLIQRRATFNGKHIIPPDQTTKRFWRYNFAAKQMIYSSFHLTKENLKYYVDSLNRFKPESIDGFISSIYEVASFIERTGSKIYFKPKVIFPTSEKVTQDYRETIERVFGCKVRDQYASSEGAPFLWECEKGNMHYDISTGVIENIDDSNEILVTSFTTYGTPLIRYAIGDSITFADENRKCNCGLKTPMVLSIEGRAIDYLYSTNGSKINLGNISNIFKSVPGSLLKSQIIQETLYELHVKLVVDSGFKREYLDILEEEIKYKLGEDMKINFDFVSDIRREQSGKYKLIVNKVVDF